jgi:NAD(P)-dependent dehydrogenase (short-subunit alcohol dehydrogenase family)
LQSSVVSGFGVLSNVKHRITTCMPCNSDPLARFTKLALQKVLKRRENARIVSVSSTATRARPATAVETSNWQPVTHCLAWMLSR